MIVPFDVRARVEHMLGIRIALAAACVPLPVSGLSPLERRCLDLVEHPRRREEWLRGRAALKAMLRELGCPEDTSGLRFPHARFSLTHSSGIAVAVGICGEDGSGIGIDYEGRRPVPPEAARFYLTEAEIQGVNLRDEEALIRLWTVKEAMYKADMNNRERLRSPAWLWTYATSGSPVAWSGQGLGPAFGGGPKHYRYASTRSGGGLLSVAVAVSGERRA
jgi:hypothetical protein